VTTMIQTTSSCARANVVVFWAGAGAGQERRYRWR
jgi:hypothetical protein